MTGRVEGKVAFITGAARGQGRAHAVRLAEEGADILAIDIAARVENTDQYEAATPEDLAETVRLVEATGRRIVSRIVDVRDLEGLTAFVNDGVAELGRLDVVVANAGIDQFGPWDSMTPEIVRTTIDVNLIGVWNTVMASVQHLIAGGGGSVILTSSANGLKAGPYNLAYNMSKYGVTGLTKSFASELAKHKVRVNSVHPGGVITAMTSTAETTFGPLWEDNPHLTGMLNGFIPGMMEAVEISNAVLFLASDETTWITGHALAVDGGLTQY